MAPSPVSAPASAPTSTPASTNPRNLRVSVAVVFVLALGFGGWGLWRVFAPGSGDVRTQLAASQRQARAQVSELEQWRQRVATLTRSDQISRDANRDLQGTLAERDEEMSGLRADVAFYERLVGATAQRRGLSMHSLNMRLQNTRPQSEAAWHFTGTLTQNLNRAAVSTGRLMLLIEGTRGGRLQKLTWDDLRQLPNAPGIPYSFRYFEQVEGDVFLPAGLTPVRVTVRLVPQSGAAIEQSVTWAEATGQNAGAGAGL